MGTVEAGERQLRRIIFSSRDFHHPVRDKAGDVEVTGSIYRQADRGTVQASKS
jgi:hypothetical protein